MSIHTYICHVGRRSDQRIRTQRSSLFLCDSSPEIRKEPKILRRNFHGPSFNAIYQNGYDERRVWCDFCSTFRKVTKCFQFPLFLTELTPILKPSVNRQSFWKVFLDVFYIGQHLKQFGLTYFSRHHLSASYPS